MPCRQQLGAFGREHDFAFDRATRPYSANVTIADMRRKLLWRPVGNIASGPRIWLWALSRVMPVGAAATSAAHLAAAE
jgi:hypothetical protein